MPDGGGTIWYMNALSSTEFRKRFAKLTAPTLVTVNGHVIGAWQPSHVSPEYVAMELATMAKSSSYNSRPFTPVPKKGK